MKKPTGKCFAATCEKCNWYKEMHMEKWENGKPTGIHEMRTVCKFEELFDFLHRLAGDFDGLQGAVNQSANKMDLFGSSCADAFKAILNNKPPKRIN